MQRDTPSWRNRELLYGETVEVRPEPLPFFFCHFANGRELYPVANSNSLQYMGELIAAHIIDNNKDERDHLPPAGHSLGYDKYPPIRLISRISTS